MGTDAKMEVGKLGQAPASEQSGVRQASLLAKGSSSKGCTNHLSKYCCLQWPLPAALLALFQASSDPISSLDGRIRGCHVETQPRRAVADTRKLELCISLHMAHPGQSTV